MYTISNLLLSYSLFHHIGHSINNQKIFMTIIKLVVSLCYCYQYYAYSDSFEYLNILLTSFFLYDIFYITFFVGFRTLVYNMIIYHHLCIIYAMNLDPIVSPSATYLLGLGEFTNIFMYSHYLLLQIKNIPSKIIQYSLYIEMASYLIIRCCYFTYVILSKEWRDTFGISFYYFVIPVYFMGMFWGKNLVYQFYIKNK